MSKQAPNRNQKKPNPLVLHMEEHVNDLRNVYKKFQVSNDRVDLIENAESLIQEIVEILDLALADLSNYLPSFVNLVRARHPESKYQTFQEFFELIAGWGVSNKIQATKTLQLQRVFLQHLDKSIKQYKVLLKQSKDPEENASIRQLLDVLTSKRKIVAQANKADTVSFSYRREVYAQEEKGVQDLFNFYSKQHLMTGKNPTFDNIGEAIDTIDSGSFLFFAKTFGIFNDRKAEGKRYLTKQEILDIFKKTAHLQRSMNILGFKQALDDIAVLFFNEEYDKLLPIPCSNLGIEEKRVMLYEYLKCGDSRYITSTCKPLGKAFSSQIEKPRPAQEDPSNKYKFRINEEIKDQLNVYKREKESKLKEEKDIKERENFERAKIAQRKLKEKKDQEDMKKRKDVLRMQDLGKARPGDFEVGENLEDLIDGN